MKSASIPPQRLGMAARPVAQVVSGRSLVRDPKVVLESIARQMSGDRVRAFPAVDNSFHEALRNFNLAPIDPIRHPAHLTLAVRALPATDHRLQRICAAMGLTFWGEAIGLILDFLAHFPELADLEDLACAPKGLTCMGGAIRYLGAPVSRGVMTPLSFQADRLVRSVAARHLITREKAATLILHHNVKEGAALIMAHRELFQ